MNTPHDRSTGRDGTSRTGASPGDPDRPAQGASNAGEAAKDVAEQLKSEGKAQVDQYRDVAADKIDTLADSVKAAASKLEGDDVGHLSGHIADMADSMSRLSDGLRNKSTDQILHDVSRIARENPALFVAGSIAVGFGLTRFARASAQGIEAGGSASVGSSQRGSPGAGQGSTRGAGSNPDRAGSASGSAGRSESHMPGMVGHPATSSGGSAGGGIRSSNTANIPGAGATGETANPASGGSGTGTSYSTASSINDASLGTGAGSTSVAGRSRDPGSRDAGGGSTAAAGALDPSSAPYNTTPEQSNGRKPS
jgi:hypothetical protein